MTVKTQAMDLRTALLHPNMRSETHSVWMITYTAGFSVVNATDKEAKEEEGHAHLGKLVRSSASHFSNTKGPELCLQLFELHSECTIMRFTPGLLLQYCGVYMAQSRHTTL